MLHWSTSGYATKSANLLLKPNYGAWLRCWGGAALPMRLPRPSAPLEEKPTPIWLVNVAALQSHKRVSTTFGKASTVPRRATIA